MKTFSSVPPAAVSRRAPPEMFSAPVESGLNGMENLPVGAFSADAACVRGGADRIWRILKNRVGRSARAQSKPGASVQLKHLLTVRFPHAGTDGSPSFRNRSRNPPIFK